MTNDYCPFPIGVLSTLQTRRMDNSSSAQACSVAGGVLGIFGLPGAALNNPTCLPHPHPHLPVLLLVCVTLLIGSVGGQFPDFNLEQTTVPNPQGQGQPLAPTQIAFPGGFSHASVFPDQVCGTSQGDGVAGWAKQTVRRRGRPPLNIRRGGGLVGGSPDFTPAQAKPSHPTLPPPLWLLKP